MVLAVFISTTMILRKQDTVKTLSWVVVLMLLPYIGIICYILFGQTFRKKHIFNRKGIADYKIRREASRKQIELLRKNPELLGEELSPFPKLLYQNLKNSHTIIEDNDSIEFYFTGKEALDAMYSEIENALHHIHLQSYIITEDKTGKRFKELLIKKARQGVETRLIYDGMGSFSLKKQFRKELEDAGVEVLEFQPVGLSPKALINYRNHRKILVIDGKTGFVGGVNIADRY